MEGFKTLLRKESRASGRSVSDRRRQSSPRCSSCSFFWKIDRPALPGVNHTSLLVPGLVMMTVLQNAFANSSSSLIQSKITGNIVFVLLPPIPYASSTPPT